MAEEGDSLTRLAPDDPIYNAGIFNIGTPGTVYRPHRIRLSTAIGRLIRASGIAWTPACARCLALKFISQATMNGRALDYFGWVFSLDVREKIMRVGKQKKQDRALDRLVPVLERGLLLPPGPEWMWPKSLAPVLSDGGV